MQKSGNKNSWCFDCRVRKGNVKGKVKKANGNALLKLLLCYLMRFLTHNGHPFGCQREFVTNYSILIFFKVTILAKFFTKKRK